MPRPIWKGSITFGLVNVPVQLEMAVHEKSISFHMLSKDGTCRLRRKLYCPETGKEYDFDQTAHGIEIGKGEYAVVDESEIKRLRPESGRVMEIVQFIKPRELDPLYFDRPYFVVPTEGSVKPYKLLHEAMKQSQYVALATFVMRERQYLSAIRILGEGLVLHTMHYVDEVESIDDSLPPAMDRAKPSAAEVQIARQLIQAMTRPLDLSKFHDEYREKLERLVEEKSHGGTVTVSEEHPDKPLPPTTNLMAALRRSLGGSPQGNGLHVSGGRTARRKPPAARRSRRAAKR